MHSQQQQQQQPPQSLLQSQHHNHHHSHHHHPHNHHQQQQQPQQPQQHHHHHHQPQQHQHQHHHHHQQQHHQPQQQQQPPLPPQQHQQQHQQHPHGPHPEQPNYHTQSHHTSHIHQFHGQHHVNHSQQSHPQHRHQSQQHQQHHHNHQLQQHHHIAPHGIPSMVQYQSNLMYQPHMGHHAFPPTGHIQQPSFNHASAQNHRFDHINVNPQSQAQPPAQPQTQTQAQSQTQTQPQPQAQPQTQTQPQSQTQPQPQPQPQSQQQHPPIQQQPPLAPPQQSQVPPGSMNPNNMPHLSQISAPIMPSPNVGSTGVHPMGNGPMIETHMQNRIPVQQWQFLSTHFSVPQHHMLGHPYPHMSQNYHGPHITTPNPAMMTTRMQLEMSVRPPFELHNPTVPIATKVPISQAASIPAAKPQVGTIPTVAAAAQQMAPTVAPTRERRRLAIVDPKTRRELTDDELKGSEKSQSSASTTDSASTPSTSASTVTTSTAIITTSTTTAKPSTVESAQTTVLKEVDVAPTNQTIVPEVISNNSRQTTLPPIPETSIQTSPPGDQAQVTNRNVSPPDSSISSSNSPVLDTKSVAAKEQSTTSNAIEKTASTIIDGMQALSISASSNGAPTIVSKPEVKANLDGVKTLNSNEIDHVISRSDDGDATNHDSKLESDKEKNNVGAEPAETPKRELPNLPYSKGQYSPLNPTGHRRYKIEFLKAIGRQICPVEVPPEPHRDPLAPRFMPPTDMPTIHRDYGMPRRASQQTLNSKQPARKIIATQSLQTEMEIKTAEKPWKPELETEKTRAIESGEIDTQRLLKLFRGLLNKITPQKYDSIIEKIEALDLEGDDRLKSVIDLVFDKAVDEPGFCALYASMSKVIATRDSKFNHHLLKKCQDEFETNDLYSGLNVEGREQDIENESDAAKKKLLSEELYEDMRLRRKKYLGTITLIGEMYKLGLLVPKIIGFCITRLLEDLSNENLECLCSLIGTVGAKMAKEEDDIIKASIKNTLNVLNDIANNKRTSELFTLESRIRFKILDTIELSKRNWRPRMVEDPKKISEIHDDSNKSRMQNFPRNNLKNNDVYLPQRRIQNQSSTRR